MIGDASRRRFLAGATVLLGWPRDAAALSLQPMDAATAQAFTNACGASAEDHRSRALAFLRENAARPDGERLPPEAASAVLAGMRCPLCGCVIGPLEPLPKPL